MRFALLFPGQGCQYIGMCAKLIEEYQAAYEVFEEANRALGYDIRSLILKGNIEELTLSKNAQPAVVTAGYALYRVFEEQIGIKPFCAAGHSLGEITALVCAGAVSFPMALYLPEKEGNYASSDGSKEGRSGVVVDLKFRYWKASSNPFKPKNM